VPFRVADLGLRTSGSISTRQRVPRPTATKKTATTRLQRLVRVRNNPHPRTSGDRGRSHVWGPSFVLVETLKRLAGIEPAWPAWKTAPDAWSGASTCGRAGALCPVSDHGLPPLIVKDANSTPQVVDRELAKLQNPAHRPARPPRTSPLAPTGDAAWLTRRNALVTSPGFSLLLDVRQPDDGPEPILDGAAVCIPSIWRSPTTRQPGAALDGIGACVVWLCPRAGVW
jgi:hypothetical protein